MSVATASSLLSWNFEIWNSQVEALNAISSEWTAMPAGGTDPDLLSVHDPSAFFLPLMTLTLAVSGTEFV